MLLIGGKLLVILGSLESLAGSASRYILRGCDTHPALEWAERCYLGVPYDNALAFHDLDACHSYSLFLTLPVMPSRLPIMANRLPQVSNNLCLHSLLPGTRQHECATQSAQLFLYNLDLPLTTTLKLLYAS